MNETRASVEDFTLDRHAVVEASAGTGKTYTIETLVQRLLIEEAVPLDKILIVTFTEKATGDLKLRLRGTFERAIQKDAEHAAILTPAVDHFDLAPIFTIHGFCQRLLQEYALEQGQDFRAELVNDPDLLKTLLREIQTKTWRSHFGDRLRGVLEKAGYHRETADAWDRKVLDLAKSFKPRSGHQLRPTFMSDWWRRLDEVDANWAGQLEIFTVQRLHERLREYKRQRGLHSFDDMIATVEESLDRARNRDADSFLSVLRERYRYGIVDEFQDTDPLQWRIFRRIFLEGGGSKLFVVGDPKQAIFGFRGADLPTYLNAADEMRTQHDAAAYPLQVNWRSAPDLLDALNCVFRDGEWFPPETRIHYLEVYPPDDDVQPTRIEDDRSDRAALTMVDVTQWDKLKTAQKNYARFVATEIQRLLGEADQPVITFAHKGKPARPLNAGDICLLITKRLDAVPLIEALDLACIPYSFYKRSDLWQSDEAVHLEMLLQTLARPDESASLRQALLTCFFRVPPAELARNRDVPAAHPARQLFQAWIAFADQREWSALFASVVEDTGLVFQATQDVAAERRLATLRQLLGTLESVAYGANLDLRGVGEWIRDRRRQREASDAESQPADAGRAKVKIMTIHASKGLEFPIVFLAGGFTQGLVNSGVATYRDDQQQVVFDLGPDADARERVGAERLSEQQRLLYVALTRPIFKLYLPKIKKPRHGSRYLGPLGTILMPALERACPDKLGPLVAEFVTPPLFIQVAPASVPATSEKPSADAAIQIAGPLFPPVDANLGKRRIVVRSFSSMARHHLSPVGEGASYGDQPTRAEDETPTPIDREDPLRGPVFGDMVHNVLEHMDFADVARAGSLDALLKGDSSVTRQIDEQIKRSIGDIRTRTPRESLEQACRAQMASLIWHTLRTPLAAVGGPLCAIPARDRLTEVEFVFPEAVGAAPPPDMRWHEGFVTGFMDLLFRKENKYFLVDWKTNLLGSYTRESIEHSMADSDYHRQYRLYLHALARWLTRMHGRGFSFGKQFGGVYYLYVRGMNGRDETTGVYFHRPTQADLDLQAVIHG